jgi:hypothetical protein
VQIVVKIATICGKNSNRTFQKVSDLFCNFAYRVVNRFERVGKFAKHLTIMGNSGL